MKNIIENLDKILSVICLTREVDEDEFEIEDKEIISKFQIKELEEGEGGGRIAFEVLNDFVIKIPKSEYGEKQSEIENTIAGQESLLILCKTFNSWKTDIVLQEKLTAIDDYFYTNTNIIQYLQQYRPELLTIYQKEIDYLLKTYDLLEEDLLKICSWGKDKDDNIKLFDFGCTNYIYNNYY